MFKNAFWNIGLTASNIKLIESRKRTFYLCFVPYKNPTETFNKFS